MYCKNCGAQIPDDSKFCKVCGAKQDTSVSHIGNASSEEPKFVSTQTYNASRAPTFVVGKKKTGAGKIIMRIFGILFLFTGLMVSIAILTEGHNGKMAETWPALVFAWLLGVFLTAFSFRTKASPISAYSSGFVPPKKKRSGAVALGVIVALFGILAVAVSIANQPKANGGANNTSKSSHSEVSQTADSLLEFDKKAWEDFKNLYNTHNALMNAMDSYANGNLSSVELYDECSDIEKYFRKVSYSFDYGTTEDEKTYLRTYQTAALADQMAASNLKNYLDSLKTSDLSAAKNEIQRAKEAYFTIAENRGKLLVKAGLTEEEVKAKIEQDTADLDSN